MTFKKYCIFDPNADAFLKYSKDAFNDTYIEFMDELLSDSPDMVFNFDYMPVFDVGDNNSLQVVPIVDGECDWANYISFLEFAVLYLDMQFGDLWRK